MTERIIYTISLLGSWSYLIIFLAAFLESSAFLGLFVPGESIVVVAGLLSSQGYLDLWDCIAVISLGAVLGDTAGYILGKVLGRGYFERHGKLLFIKAKHLKKADDYFREHGGKTVFFGRFVGFLRAMAPFAAGVSKMPYGRFFIYNVTGGILWAVSFTSLGYFFGLSWQTIERWAGRAGVFVFFFLLVIAGFGYLYRALLKRQAELYSWFNTKYENIASSPTVKAFVEKHPALVSFLTERLSPGNYLGAHLTAGLLLSSVFIWVLGKIIEDILTGEPLVLLDRWVFEHIVHLKTPLTTDIMLGVTRLGGVDLVLSGGVLAGIYLLVKKRGDYLVGLIAALLGGIFLDLVLKSAVHRVIPAVDTSFAGSSFPSVHAIMSVIFYGMTAYFLVRNIKSWKLQVLISLAALFIVFLVGFSRLYLQAHYLSDVAAGYAGGFFWLTVCITGLEVYRKKKDLERADG